MLTRISFKLQGQTQGLDLHYQGQDQGHELRGQGLFNDFCRLIVLSFTTRIYLSLK